MTTYVVIGVVALVIIYFIAAYNVLVQLKNRVANGWSQIDVQLKRRHDLIPNLVETVKGYMDHERELLTAVTEARTRASGTAGAGTAAAPPRPRLPCAAPWSTCWRWRRTTRS